MICNACQHEFDLRKPQADWKKRRINLCLIINGIGAVGILLTVSLVVFMIWKTSRPY